MSAAWETTLDDVQNTCANNNHHISESIAKEILGKLDHGAIEKAALYGNDMDEQTDYAYSEIWKQVKNLNEGN